MYQYDQKLVTHEQFIKILVTLSLLYNLHLKSDCENNVPMIIHGENLHDSDTTCLSMRTNYKVHA